MIADDAISRIVERTRFEMSGIDQGALRVIIEDVLSSYDVTLKDGLDAVSDLPEKIGLYMDAKRLDGLSEKTLKNNAYHLNRFARFVQKKAAAISTVDLRKFLSHLMETRSLKSTSLESEKSILKAFFAWLEEEEYIGKNPAKKIKPTKVDKRIRKALTLEELELMRDACTTTRQRCMFELFYSAGIRLDELHGVDVGHLNWQDNSIRVIGKGNKERVVYFSDRAKIYLKRYIAERGMLGTDALFITSKQPHARMGHKSIQNEIKAIAKAAGITKPVYPHLLRHSFATHGLKSGMSLNVIHDLLGHEKLDTTLIYARTDQETAQYEYKKYHNQ